MVFKDTFNVISLLSPYLIPLYLLMGSFFNQDIKGLIYLLLLTCNVYLTFGYQSFKITRGELKVMNFGPLWFINNGKYYNVWTILK